MAARTHLSTLCYQRFNYKKAKWWRCFSEQKWRREKKKFSPCKFRPILNQTLCNHWLVITTREYASIDVCMQLWRARHARTRDAGFPHCTHAHTHTYAWWKIPCMDRRYINTSQTSTIPATIARLFVRSFVRHFKKKTSNIFSDCWKKVRYITLAIYSEYPQTH